MIASAARTDANGTMWRLRSLIAMGHDCARIARALGARPGLVRRVVRGQAHTVTGEFRAAACQLWDAWWDKTPLAHTPAQRRAAARALRQAKTNDWPAAAALEEDLLDEPGYRPWCRYRPATGTGTAPDFPPARPRPLEPGRSHDHHTRRPSPTTAREGGTSDLPPPQAPPIGEAARLDGRVLRTELPAELASARQARSAVRQALTA